MRLRYHLAERIDEVKPLRQSGIFKIYFVLHIVEQHRHFEFEIQHADARHFGALVGIRGLREENLVTLVRRYLPAVGWVNFLYIDDIEIHLLPELAVNFVHAHGVFTKGRSRIGAED